MQTSTTSKPAKKRRSAMPPVRIDLHRRDFYDRQERDEAVREIEQSCYQRCGGGRRLLRKPLGD